MYMYEAGEVSDSQREPPSYPRGTARKMLLENSSRTQAITDTRFQVSRRTYVTQEQHENNISVLLEIDLW